MSSNDRNQCSRKVSPIHGSMRSTLKLDSVSTHFSNIVNIIDKTGVRTENWFLEYQFKQELTNIQIYLRVVITSSRRCMQTGKRGSNPSPMSSASSSTNSQTNFLNFSLVSLTTTSVPQMTSEGAAATSLVGPVG